MQESSELAVVRQEAAKKYEEQRKLEKTREFAQQFKSLVSVVDSFYEYIESISEKFDNITMTEILALQEKLRVIKTCMESILKLKDKDNEKIMEDLEDPKRLLNEIDEDLVSLTQQVPYPGQKVGNFSKKRFEARLIDIYTSFWQFRECILDQDDSLMDSLQSAHSPTHNSNSGSALIKENMRPLLQGVYIRELQSKHRKIKPLINFIQRFTRSSRLHREVANDPLSVKIAKEAIRAIAYNKYENDFREELIELVKQCIKHKSISMLEILLAHPLAWTKISMEGCLEKVSVLQQVVEANWIDGVKMLLKQDLKENQLWSDEASWSNEKGVTGKQYRSVLHTAARQGNTEMIKLIKDKYPTLIKAPDLGGALPLHLAINTRKLEAARELVDANNINHQTNAGKSALHLAIASNQLDMVKLLLEHKADVNLPDNEGNTPLHLAVKHASLPILNLLLENGAKADRVNKQGQLPAHLAFEVCKESSVKIDLMLEAYPNAINQEDEQGCTPIFYAIKNDHVAGLQSLIEKGANIKHKNKRGNNVLLVSLGDTTSDDTLYCSDYPKFEFVDDKILDILVSKDASILNDTNNNETKLIQKLWFKYLPIERSAHPVSKEYLRVIKKLILLNANVDPAYEYSRAYVSGPTLIDAVVLESRLSLFDKTELSDIALLLLNRGKKISKEEHTTSTGREYPSAIRTALASQEYNIRFIQTLRNNHKIDNISNRWQTNSVTQKKKLILENFVAYIEAHQGVDPATLVKNWLLDYRLNHQNENPLKYLQEHRGIFKHSSFFSKHVATSCTKILDDYIRHFQSGQAHENLSTVVRSMNA